MHYEAEYHCPRCDVVYRVNLPEEAHGDKIPCPKGCGDNANRRWEKGKRSGLPEKKDETG